MNFDIFNSDTWNLADDKLLLTINGNKLIKYGKYITEKDCVDELRGIFKYKHKLYKGKSDKEIIESHLKMTYAMYAEKDLEPVFTVNGFPFTKALCDCCRDNEKETLEKIADAMNSCIGQNLKKYQYKQYFFENNIPASKEFFIEIYFAEQYSPRKSVDDLIVSFYSEFEPETKEEINSVISGSLYLSAHKELIPPIKEHLLTRYF